MNYLAHILLSGADSGIQVGNFIGDAVKGGDHRNYPAAIERGILLHRAIDAYTDGHPAVKEAVRALKPYFGRYSGALLDIYFDYLLASRFREFSPSGLRRLAWRFYLSMILHRRYLPVRIKRFMWHFILTDRLSKYATVEGIGESLDIMSRYGRMDIHAGEAVAYLVSHEEELREVFHPFFTGLQAYCRDYIKKTAL